MSVVANFFLNPSLANLSAVGRTMFVLAFGSLLLRIPTTYLFAVLFCKFVAMQVLKSLKCNLQEPCSCVFVFGIRLFLSMFKSISFICNQIRRYYPDKLSWFALHLSALVVL